MIRAAETFVYRHKSRVTETQTLPPTFICHFNTTWMFCIGMCAELAGLGNSGHKADVPWWNDLAFSDCVQIFCAEI